MSKRDNVRPNRLKSAENDANLKQFDNDLPHACYSMKNVLLTCEWNNNKEKTHTGEEEKAS